MDRSSTKTKSYGVSAGPLRDVMLAWGYRQPPPKRGPQGFPATALAELSGVTPRTIWRIVRGQEWIQWDTADRLGTALGLHLSDLTRNESPTE